MCKTSLTYICGHGFESLSNTALCGYFSARIQGRKRKTLTEDTTEQEIIETFSRKRKAEDDLAETLCKKPKVTGTEKVGLCSLIFVS